MDKLIESFKKFEQEKSIYMSKIYAELAELYPEIHTFTWFQEDGGVYDLEINISTFDTALDDIIDLLYTAMNNLLINMPSKIAKTFDEDNTVNLEQYR